MWVTFIYEPIFCVWECFLCLNLWQQAWSDQRPAWLMEAQQNAAIWKQNNRPANWYWAACCVTDQDDVTFRFVLQESQMLTDGWVGDTKSLLIWTANVQSFNDRLRLVAVCSSRACRTGSLRFSRSPWEALYGKCRVQFSLSSSSLMCFVALLQQNAKSTKHTAL